MTEYLRRLRRLACARVGLRPPLHELGREVAARRKGGTGRRAAWGAALVLRGLVLLSAKAGAAFAREPVVRTAVQKCQRRRRSSRSISRCCSRADRFALVALLLAARERELDLRAGTGEVEARRHQREAL